MDYWDFRTGEHCFCPDEVLEDHLWSFDSGRSCDHCIGLLSGSQRESCVRSSTFGSMQDELAKGNLRLEALKVESADEIGALTRAFNVASGNIRELIRKMAATAEQVAASSEELTASAQQSAEAANHVAGTVGRRLLMG